MSERKELNDVCKQVFDNVNGALACALVSMKDGTVQGIYHTTAYFDQAYVDLVAAAAFNTFAGDTIQQVERRLSAQKGMRVERSIEEAFMTTTRTYHFMELIRSIDCVVVLVTKKDVLQGLGWAQVRKAIPLFAEKY